MTQGNFANNGALTIGTAMTRPSARWATMASSVTFTDTTGGSVEVDAVAFKDYLMASRCNFGAGGRDNR
jgi:hypothetical protein